MTDNERAFLRMLYACEGTDPPDGYRALFGYHPTRNPTRVFDSFERHPNIRFAFKQTDGTIAFTTAAGAPQFIFKTWERIRVAIEAPDFSPPWQDAGAIWLIDVDGQALEDVNVGRFQDAIDKCAGTWASLPASKYPQPTRSREFALAAYRTAGGVLA